MVSSKERVRIAFGSAVPGIALIFSVTIGLLLFSSLGFAQHTYYISKSIGSDSYTSTQAQSKSTPWQHLPGMAGCTTGCAAIAGWNGPEGPGNGYVPVPGDKFILYGGDTWGGSDLPINYWYGSGTAPCETTPNSSCMYIGVDTTWYSSSVCGSSFCRPIFNQGGTPQQWYAMAYIAGQNVTIDNIEFTGLHTSGGNTSRMVSLGSGDVVEHCYFHGWTHDASGDLDDSHVIDGAATGTAVHDNVIDGADTLAATAVAGNPCGDPSGICQGMMTAINGAASAYNNVIKNVTSGIVTSVDIAHDNWIGPVWLGFQGGHRNAVQIAGSVSLPYLLAYNNIVTQVQNGGMGPFWLGQGSGNAGITSYAFNNVLFGSNVAFWLCQEPLSGGSCGPFYIFNNTIEGQVGLASSMTSSSVANIINNHCIGQSACTNNQGSWTVHETTNFPQCSGTGTGCAGANSSPHFDQYTDSQTHALSPVASTNSTVHAGTNEQALCTTISGLNAAAGTACQNSTSYACSYNTTNHTVTCPADPLVARPTSTAWDIGAYQYNAGDPPPNPPAALTAVVH